MAATIVNAQMDMLATVTIAPMSTNVILAQTIVPNLLPVPMKQVHSPVPVTMDTRVTVKHAMM
jgi:hypothetical protein